MNTLANEVQVGEEKNGGSVVIKLDTILTVRLPYRKQDFDDETTFWLLDADGAPVLRLLNSTPGVADKGVGTHQWRFKAVALGGRRLQMSYKQQWEESPTRKFRLTVTVIAK